MTQQFHLLNRGIAALVFVAASIVTASAETVVYVADVEHLYAAVNDPANEGAAVVLAPGVYVLSPTDPAGNPGRLELQKDMSLYGVAGDRGAVVIDATALMAAAFSAPFGRTGVIRTGRGSNAVEWLTVVGSPYAAATVETDLVSTPEVRIRVAHLVAGGSARGVDIRNIGTNMARRRIDAEIIDSELFGGVEGIRVANFSLANEGDISVDMRGNHSYDNRLGCIFENNRSSSAKIHVRSAGDRFDENGLGCQIGGGIVLTTGAANSNSTTFEAHGTEFVNNIKRSGFCALCGGPVLNDFGGVFVAGGEAVALPETTSGNTVLVTLWGCKVADNVVSDPDFDFHAFGAILDLPGTSDLAGTDNHTTIELHGVSTQIDVVSRDSLPDDQSGSNTVTVIRSPDAP